MDKKISYLFVFLLVLLRGTYGYAFNLKTAFTPACHEEMAAFAIFSLSWPKDIEDGEPTREERAALEVLDLDEMFPGTTSQITALVLGVRDPDLLGHAVDDLLGLASVHADPLRQMEHCLRAPDQDGDEGNVLALASCREQIMTMIAQALGDGDVVDGEARVRVEVALPYEGTVPLRLRRFGFFLGRALHTLEDGFSHTFRSPDGHRVRHVLNYVDWAKGHGDARRDGEAHSSALDLCGGETAGVLRRVAWAKVASRELFDAVLDPSGGRAGRLRRAERVLDTWLRFEGGCDLANRYCDAPELDEVGGCSVSGEGGLLGVVLALLLALGLRRRERGRWSRRVRFILGIAVALVALVGPSVVWAGPPPCAQPSLLPVGSRPGKVALLSSVGASLDNGGFSFTLGARVAISSRVGLGLTAELNPWHAIEIPDIDWGAFNLYASVSFRWTTFSALTLTTTAHAGMSVLLFDLVSAEKGSTGLYFGVSLLGIRYRISKRLHLVIEPAEVAVPIPQLKGIPLVYIQYRITLGLLFVLN